LLLRTGPCKPKISRRAQARCWCGRVRPARSTSTPRSGRSHGKALLTPKNMLPTNMLPKNMRPKNMRPWLDRRALHMRRPLPEICTAKPRQHLPKRGVSSRRSVPAVGPINRTRASPQASPQANPQRMTRASKVDFSATPIEAPRFGAMQSFTRKNDPDTTLHHRQARPDCVRRAEPFR